MKAVMNNNGISMATVASREDWVQSDGLNLRFVEWGPTRAPTIVMLHGLRSYAYTWEPVALALAPRWRVIALDQRGRGESDWDPSRNYFLESYVRDLEVLINALSIDQFVLLGHSMGGANALVYASRHPDRLAALVIEDMGPGASTGSAGAERIIRELSDTPISFASWDDAADFWRKIRPNISATALRSRVEHSLKQGMNDDVIWRYDAEGIAHARLNATQSQLVDLWPHVESLRTPTLLIRGAESDFLSTETAQDMCRRNFQIRWIDVPSSTHYVHDDNLAGFNSALLPFLAEISATTT